MTSRRAQHHDRRQGFSILEVVVVTALFGLVLFAITSLRGNLDALDNIISQRLQSREDLEQTMQIFTTELRSAGQSDQGGYPLATAATSSIVFYSDVDKDGVFERVRYALNGETIMKGVTEPSGNPSSYPASSEVTSTIVHYVVQNPSTTLFAYYGDDYTGSEAALAAPVDVSDVRIVKIEVYADVDPELSPQPAFFTETVNIRNLRTN